MFVQSIYMDVGGVGSWAFRDCEVSHTAILCGKRCPESGRIEAVDLEIPFYLCRSDSAELCGYGICAKPHSFSVLLEDNCPGVNVNRRLSSDGRRKTRFLAAAPSADEADRWCKSITDATKSFVDWANDIHVS